MKKRVMLLCSGLGSGGAERQLVGLADMLQKEGYNIEVVWYSNNNFYKSFLVERNIAYRQLLVSNHFKKIILIAKEIERYNPDIVISYLSGANVIASLLKMIGMRFKLIVSERNTTTKKSLRVRLRFFLYKYVDYIVPNSFSQDKFIRDNYPSLADKLNTITNFTDTSFFVPPAENKVRIDGWHKMLVVARIEKQKNIEGFLDCVKILKDNHVKVHIEWFGSASVEDYRQHCYDLRNKLDIGDYVSFNPPTHNILEQYQSSDIFCLPSFHEGFPNVICEAMSCGLPILCSDICDNPYIVKDMESGLLFNPMSSEDMAMKISYYINNMSHRKSEIGKLNRDRIIAICSKESFLRKYINLIG